MDVGAGTGFMLKAAVEAGLETYGVDVSAEAIKIAGQVEPAAKLVLAAGEALPFPDKTFDYVSCLGALEHFKDVGKGIAEMARVGTERAVFLIVVPNRRFWLRLLPGNLGVAQPKVHEILMDYDDWVAIFRRHGLSVVAGLGPSPRPG